MPGGCGPRIRSRLTSARRPSPGRPAAADARPAAWYTRPVASYTRPGRLAPSREAAPAAWPRRAAASGILRRAPRTARRAHFVGAGHRAARDRARVGDVVRADCPECDGGAVRGSVDRGSGRRRGKLDPAAQLRPGLLPGELERAGERAA